MIRIILLSIITVFAISQEMTDDLPFRDLIKMEKNSIEAGRISENTFLYPHLQKSGQNPYINFSGVDAIRIEPVLGVRWSSGGFEMVSDQIPSAVLWLTPGLKISARSYLFDPHLNLWLYAWGRFNKHSAIGFNGNIVLPGQQLFQYSPLNSIEYYSQSEKPENSIDFDETLGGVAIMHPKFDLVWGKFRNHIGPSTRSNIHLSRNTPAYSQFRIHIKPYGNVHLTFLLGQLESGIPDSVGYHQMYEDTLGIVEKIPTLQRYITMHRIDVIRNRKFRVGVWEQVIFGGRNIPFEYLNPLTLYWSAQHKLGDIDNVQMGFDWELLLRQNRFYGAFFMDEWSLFKTFDFEKNHNWFGVQIGWSKKMKMIGKETLITGEINMIDPRAYTHRFRINEPQHHSYNLGYWSGGNSLDIWLSAWLMVNDELNVSIFAGKMKKGDQDVIKIYQLTPVSWLSGNTIQRNIVGVEGSYRTGKQVECSVKLQYLNTAGIYRKNDFMDLTISLLYNLYQ